MKGDMWRSTPLYYEIVEELRRKNGRARNDELYRYLRERFDLTYTEFLKALMKLEMQGIIRVVVLREGIMNIELVANP